MDIGTKIFIDKHAYPNNSFLQTINQWYNSSYKHVDFSQPEDAVHSINEWAKNITHGHIQNLITEGQLCLTIYTNNITVQFNNYKMCMFILAETKANTVLILLNAIYFKGYWTTPFNVNLTKIGKFYLNSKTTVDVPLMTIFNSFQISNIEPLDSRVISLPYRVSIIIVFFYW